MVAENHDIDRLFRDRLEEVEINPPERVWRNIEKSLYKRRKVAFLAIAKGLSVAAAVVVALLGGWWFTQSHREELTKEVAVAPQEQTVIPPKTNINAAPVASIQTETPAPEATQTMPKGNVAQVVKAVSLKENRIQKSGSLLAALTIKSDKGNTVVGRNHQSLSYRFDTSKARLREPENWFDLLSKFLGKDKGTQLTISEAAIRDQETIAANIQVYKQDKKPVVNRWRLMASATPLFTGSVSTGNRGGYLAAAGETGTSSPHTNTEATLSGGLMFGYKLSKRLSVKSGLVYSEIRHNTDAVPVIGSSSNNLTNLTSAYGVNPNNVVFAANTTVGTVNFRNPPESGKDPAYFSNIKNNELGAVYSTNADLKQNMAYMEIPVLVSYKLVDRKVNIDLNGGLSTNILIGNNASLYEAGTKTQSGETSQLRNLVYAGTVGLGFGYELSKRVILSLEPRVKYYLNSISKNSHINYRPYQLGIYTGVTYAFN